jgi:SAM-dependent methyltransferase
MADEVAGLTSPTGRRPVDDGLVPPRLAKLLACPRCQGAVEEARPGRLECGGCGAHYPVRDRVPRMLPGEIPAQVAETADAFGWQWHAFSEQLPAFREEFLEWLAPVTPDTFRGKRVLDAGCGKGRHLLATAEFGAEHVVGIDISSAVEVARQATADLPAVDIVQGDLLTPPLREEAFDLIYSVGVVHHVPEPSAAIQALTRCLHRGGTLHVWVYAHEGNALVRWFADPLRRRLARGIPREIVRAGTLPPAIILLVAARLAGRLDRVPSVPYAEYLRRIGRYSLRHVWAIVYDQLMAPTTHYVRRGDLESWFQTAGLVDIRIRNSRNMSWTATARRP